MPYSAICVQKNVFTVIDTEYWAEVSSMGSWYLVGENYVGRGCSQKRIYLHKIIYSFIDPLYDGIVDHANGNKLINTKDNLRPATKQQNIWNSNMSRRNTSGVKGVSWAKSHQKWLAQIRINGQLIHLGLFETLEEAKRVRQQAAINYFGNFARETE